MGSIENLHYAGPPNPDRTGRSGRAAPVVPLPISQVPLPPKKLKIDPAMKNTLENIFEETRPPKFPPSNDDPKRCGLSWKQIGGFTIITIVVFSAGIAIGHYR